MNETIVVKITEKENLIDSLRKYIGEINDSQELIIAENINGRVGRNELNRTFWRRHLKREWGKDI